MAATELVGHRPLQDPPAGLSAGGPLESAAAATVIALTAWQNRQTFQKLQKAAASSRFTFAAALPIPSPSFPLAVFTQLIDCPAAICEPSGRAGPTMMRMRGRLLTCFYCGKRSSIRYDGRIRDFRCTLCEATNYLDEVCEMFLSFDSYSQI